MNKGIKVIHKKCSPDLALDRSLPYTAYLVTYVEDGQTFYDISTCSKQVELFDYYYDSYNGNFKSMNQTEGRINPRVWSPKKEETKK